MEAPKRKRIIHYCARCGKEMQYEEKRMLYTYGIQKARTWRNEEYIRPFARMKLNLCPKCGDYVESLIETECAALDGLQSIKSIGRANYSAAHGKEIPE